MIIEKSEKAPLPGRPPFKAPSHFIATGLSSNLFRIKVSLKAITAYHLTFSPDIPPNSRGLRLQVLKEVEAELNRRFGSFALSSSTIYVRDKIQAQQFEVEAHKFKINFRRVKVVDVEQNPLELIKFISRSYKTLLRGIGLTEVGRSGLMVDPATKVKVTADLALRVGYYFKVNSYEGGLFLRINPTCRISRQQTVKEYIDSIYDRTTEGKERARQLVKEKLEGHIVLANYGNQRYYRVKQVIFGRDAREIKLGNDSEQTLFQYYRDRYKLQIRVPKAPMLSVQSEKKKDGETLLLAELCVMTGLPEDVDESVRKNISAYTIKDAEFRYRQILDVASKVKSSTPKTGQISLQQMAKGLGIQFSSKPEQVNGLQIQPNELMLGEKCSIEKGRAQAFQLFDKPLYDVSRPINVLLLHFDAGRAGIDSLGRIMTSTSRNFKIKLNCLEQKASKSDANRLMEVVQRAIHQRKTSQMILLIVLPPRQKHQYNKLKQFCLNQAKVPSQVVVESTLNRNGLPSIITKILLQIIAKCGNVAWCPRTPSSAKGTMLCALEIGPQKSKPKSALAALVATVNSDFSKFYSVTCSQPKTTVFIESVGQLLCKALELYYKNLEQLPEQIVILRSGAPANQSSLILQREISSIENMFKEAGIPSLPRLTYIVVDRVPDERFFQEPRPRAENPGFGTVIRSHLVESPFSFFMIAQKVGRGMAKPVQFRVLKSDSKMGEEVLLQLLFMQCFNYMNWTGPVRVPSVMQYAAKLVRFEGENLSGPVLDQELRKSLYYL